MNRKILLVHNPTAGRGKAAKLIPHVVEMLEKEKIAYLSVQTTAERNATAVVRKHLGASFTDVLVVGGDGTLNEVVNGMRGFNVPLGIIPAGTGNDYVKMLKLGKTLHEQLSVALHGSVQSVDLGLCNDRLFLNGMGIGFDGQIAKNMQQSSTWLQGHAKYYYHVLKILAFFGKIKLEIAIDSEVKQKEYLLLTIAKGTTFGGGFRLTPHASLTDGQFALCEIGPMSALRRFFNILKLEKGTHDMLPEVSFSKAQGVVIEAAPHALAHIDGEFIGSPPFKVSVLPLALLVRTEPL